MSGLDITAQDFPALRDALDTIAEHDLSDAPIGESPAVRDEYANAAQATRDARSAIMRAIDALRHAGVRFDADDDADE